MYYYLHLLKFDECERDFEIADIEGIPSISAISKSGSHSSSNFANGGGDDTISEESITFFIWLLPKA